MELNDDRASSSKSSSDTMKNFAVTAHTNLDKLPATNNVEADDIHEAARLARKMFPKAVELKVEGGKTNPVRDEANRNGEEVVTKKSKKLVENDLLPEEVGVEANQISREVMLAADAGQTTPDEEAPSLEQMHAGVTAAKQVRRRSA